MFGDYLLNFLLIDAGIWIAYFSIGGVDLSMVDVIVDIIDGIPSTPATQEALQDVQNSMQRVSDALWSIAYGLPSSIDPVVTALALVTKGLLAARKAMSLITDSAVGRDLEIQTALLARAYRLLQWVAAGLDNELRLFLP